MAHRIGKLAIIGLVGMVANLSSLGCQAKRQQRRECPSPISQGIYDRDMVDKVAQSEVENLISLSQINADSQKLRTSAIQVAMKERNPSLPWRQKNILCLSGGGSFGAYSAGVLCGWTAKGNRPDFDVVTGISTGALIAPFAFLGPAYDCQLKEFYTTLESKDLYKLRLVRGLFNESLADNSGLAQRVDEVLSPQLMQEIAHEHAKGRRLYVGTTSAESKRFVIWDIGAIACKGRPEDRQLIKQILLGSSAIPGFFPPQHIAVNLDGQCLTERHVDGGVSQALFFQPPYVPPEYRSKNPNHDLAGANVYVIVAGKYYADPQPIKPMALQLAGQEISAMIYAQTRGDLQRLFTTTLLTGMNYYTTAIPTEYPAPTSSTAFEIPALVGMFNEGYRVICEDQAWRTTPPILEAGESANYRTGVCLTHEIRGPMPPMTGAQRISYTTQPPSSIQGIPAVPLKK